MKLVHELCATHKKKNNTREEENVLSSRGAPILTTGHYSASGRRRREEESESKTEKRKENRQGSWDGSPPVGEGEKNVRRTEGGKTTLEHSIDRSWREWAELLLSRSRGSSMGR